MKRSELKRLADMRLRDAHVLLGARRYAGCYYLAGYAVECGLKACIAKTFSANTIPERRKVNSVYTHDLAGLVGVADLRGSFDTERDADPEFEAKWNVVKDWKPERRYLTRATRQEAEDLYDAIADPQNGVFRWLQRHW